MEYTHLHWHSTYSFLEAIWTPKQLVAKSKELWFNAIWLTDYFSMYGAIQLYENARDNWLKPIIWTEVWFVLNIDGYNKVEDVWNICLLWKNTEWYTNLMKIVSVANQKWIAGKPKIDIETLKEYNNDIIVFMWWTESWIWKMILRSENDSKIIELIDMIKNAVWAENVYLEVVAQNENENPVVWKINKKIISLSSQLWIKLIVDNVYNYIQEQDKETREMALAIKDQKKVTDNDARRPVWDFSLMTGDKIKDIMLKNWYSESDIDSRIQTNNDIANQIDIEIIMWQALFPVYNPQSDIAEFYEKEKDGLISE